MDKEELIALIHSALKPTKIDCERLTDFEQDNDEIVMRFFGLEEEEKMIDQVDIKKMHHRDGPDTEVAAAHKGGLEGNREEVTKFFADWHSWINL